MSGFSNPVVGGGGNLIRNTVQSPNFVSNVSGWQIDKNGNAQFNSISLTGTFTVVDVNGNILSSIDSMGNITGQTVSAATDVILAGNSLIGTLAGLPQGVLNLGYIPFQTGQNGYPNTPIAAGTPTGLLTLQAVLSPGRVYRVRAPAFRVVGGTVNGYVKGAIVGVSGTSPTVSSTSYTEHYVIFDTTAGDERTMPALERDFVTTDTGPTLYTFMLTLSPTTGTVYIKNPDVNSDACAFMYIEDFGEAGGVNTYPGGNGGTVVNVTGASGGGGTSTQTYTFYPANTYSYLGSGSLRNTNGSMYQGQSSGNPGGDGSQYAYMDFSAVDTTVPAGATINWVKFRLQNQHSWYNSGMTVGLWSGQTLNNGSNLSAVRDQWAINEGQLLTHTTVNQIANDLMGSYNWLVLSANPRGSTSLQYYGYFWGGGGNTTYMPQLQINATH